MALLQSRISLVLITSGLCFGQYKTINPRVEKVVAGVSADRISETMKTLGGFGTRQVMSTATDPAKGVGAARQWILEQFKSYSPRLEVHFDKHPVKAGGRLTKDTELWNVVAILPGKSQPDVQVLVSGHYDSLASGRAPGERRGEDDEFKASDPDAIAPGVSDDASGTAVAMELARVMSQHEFDKTLVFVAFAGEEMGLYGSRLYAGAAKKASTRIEAVLNNDIVGNDVAGNALIDNRSVLVFSEDPNDSPSRQVARYVKDMAERYFPSMVVDPVFREDRFSRGGDHSPFLREGFAAVRFTTPVENFANQHTATDTFQNASATYATRVARVNAAAAASLAWGPKVPVIVRTVETGPRKGLTTPLLRRGESGYDAELSWKNDAPEADLLGYAVVVRSTLAPFWERELFVGNVTKYTFKDLSIDTHIFGVKAVDREGNESLVAAYGLAPRRNTPIETAK
jgi:Peptidase family M28